MGEKNKKNDSVSIKTKKEPGPSARFKNQNMHVDNTKELSKKAKRRLRQKLRNKEMNGITQDQIVKEVNALKTMKRLNENGRIDELERIVPNAKEINGKLLTYYASNICFSFNYYLPLGVFLSKYNLLLIYRIESEN